MGAFGLTTTAAFALSAGQDPVRTAWFDRAGRTGAGWVGGDMAASTLLPDGRSAWVFGDTFAGELRPDGTLKPGWRFLSNSMVTTGPTGAFQSYFGRGGDGTAAALIGASNDGAWYWMVEGVVDAGRLRVFALQYRMTDQDDPWGFSFTGRVVIASFRLPTLTLERVHEAPSSGTGVQWGEAVVAEGAYFYVYGSKPLPVPGYGTFHRIHVARVRRASTLLGPWQYLDASGQWVADKTRSAPVPVTNGTGGESLVHISDVRRLPDGRFGALSDAYAGVVQEYYAPTPWGPFGQPVVLYRPPETAAGYLSYSPRYHPQFDAGTATSIGYSVNGGEWPPPTNSYRPRFVRVQR